LLSGFSSERNFKVGLSIEETASIAGVAENIGIALGTLEFILSISANLSNTTTSKNFERTAICSLTKVFGIITTLSSDLENNPPKILLDLFITITSGANKKRDCTSAISQLISFFLFVMLS